MKTINEVLTVLRTAKPDIRVYFFPLGCIPTTVNSWRGVYAEPALGWRPAGYSASEIITTYPTVKSLIAELEEATTRSYSGWKGGDYFYDGNEVLHIDNYGDYTNTEIQDIEVLDYQVRINIATEKTIGFKLLLKRP
jgi:hypothetical protein